MSPCTIVPLQRQGNARFGNFIFESENLSDVIWAKNEGKKKKGEKKTPQNKKDLMSASKINILLLCGNL